MAIIRNFKNSSVSSSRWRLNIHMPNTIPKTTTVAIVSTIAIREDSIFERPPHHLWGGIRLFFYLFHPFNICSQGAQAFIDTFVTAINLINAIYLGCPFCGECRYNINHTRTQIAGL